MAKKTRAGKLSYLTTVFLFGSMVLPILVLTEDNFDPAYFVRHLILSCSIAVGVFVFLLSRGGRFEVSKALIDVLRRPVSLAFLAFIVAKVISSYHAVNLVEAWSDIISSVVCYLFFLLLSALLILDGLNRKLFLWIVFVFNGLLLALGVLEFIKLGFEWNKMGEVGSQMVNPNLFAPLFFMCMPFLFILLGDKKYKLIMGVLLFSDILMIIALQNKATYLALLFGVAACMGVYVFNYRSIVFKWGYIALLMIGVVGGLGYLNAKTNYFELLTDKEVNIHNEYNSTTERLLIWNRSISLFQDNILIGVGAGNWPLRIGEYGITDPKSDHGSKYFLRPHNELLKILTEMGLLGFMVTVVLIVLLVVNIFKLLGSRENRSIGASLLFGFAGLIAIFSFSFPTERVPHMVLILGMLALVDKNEKAVSNSGSRFILPIIGILSMAVACGYYLKIQNDALAKKMDDSRNRKQWNKVMSFHEKIDQAIYNVNYFKVPIGFYSGLSFYHGGKIQEAKGEFINALRCNPNHILTLTNLATCYQQLSALDSAIYFFKQALIINPNFETAKQNLAITYYNAGDAIKAWEALLKCEKVPVPIKAAITRKYLIHLLNSKIDSALRMRIKAAIDQEKWMLEVFHETKKGRSLDDILKGV